MKRLLIGVGVLILVFVLIVGGAFALIESGEVVELRTSNKKGQAVSTRLWVVDDDGVPWVIPGRAGRAWLARLRADSEVELVRHGQPHCYRAVPIDVPETRDRIRALFQDKYRVQRIGARILNALFAKQGTPADVVVRLNPC